MKKLILLLSIFFLFAVQESKATHLIGGEIVWECHPTNGNYRFKVRLYRECGLRELPPGSGNWVPTAGLPPTVPLTGGPGAAIVCNLVSQQDVSPDCFDPNQEIQCGVDPVGTGAIQIGNYQSAWVTLNGIPPVNGWTFEWGECCRPASVLNLNPAGPSGFSFQLRANMYPYNNTNASS